VSYRGQRISWLVTRWATISFLRRSLLHWVNWIS
jgi:hypothetical protein